jgi:hypothetical protein
MLPLPVLAVAPSLIAMLAACTSIVPVPLVAMSPLAAWFRAPCRQEADVAARGGDAGIEVEIAGGVEQDRLPPPLTLASAVRVATAHQYQVAAAGQAALALYRAERDRVGFRQVETAAAGNGAQGGDAQFEVVVAGTDAVARRQLEAAGRDVEVAVAIRILVGQAAAQAEDDFARAGQIALRCVLLAGCRRCHCERGG